MKFTKQLEEEAQKTITQEISHRLPSLHLLLPVIDKKIENKKFEKHTNSILSKKGKKQNKTIKQDTAKF